MKKKPQPYYSKALLLQIETYKLWLSGKTHKEISEIMQTQLQNVYKRMEVIRTHLKTGYLNEDLTLK